MADRGLNPGLVLATVPVDADDILWFGRMLQEKGVDVRAEISPAVAAARDLAMIASAMQSIAGRVPDGVSVVARRPVAFDITLATATVYLIRGLRRVVSLNPELLDTWIRLMATGSPLSIPQKRTSKRDHLWEIVNASVYSHFGQNVQLNESNSGADVRGTFDDTRWGIECKVLYADKRERRIDRIVEGVKQLESDASVARGVVVVNVTDCIDHTSFRRSMSDEPSRFRSAEEALATLKTAVKDIALQTSTPTLQKRVTRDKHGRPRSKCRAVIYIGQTVALAGGRVSVYASQLTNLRLPSEPADKRFAELYHAGWRRLQDGAGARPGEREQ